LFVSHLLFISASLAPSLFFFRSFSFVEAVIYSIAYPDYGPCSSYSTKLSCEEQFGPYDTRKSICAWDTYAQDCSFIEPELDFYTTILVSMFGAVCTAPFIFLVSKVFKLAIFPAVPGSKREQAILAFYAHNKQQQGGGNSNEYMLEGGSSIDDPTVVPIDVGSSSSSNRRNSKKEFALLVKDEIERTQHAVWAQCGELQKEVDDLKAAAESSGDSSSGSSQLIAAAEEKLIQFSASWFIKQKKDGMLAWVQWAFSSHRSNRRVKTDFEMKKLIAHRIQHDMELAKEIMEELEELPSDIQEMRLMEYARANELHSVEKVIQGSEGAILSLTLQCVHVSNSISLSFFLLLLLLLLLLENLLG
jgi:hypothetical protein